MEELSSPLHFVADYRDLTGDKRLNDRAKALFDRLSLSPGSVIRKLSDDRAEQVAYYRLLENERLSEGALIEELTSRVVPLVTGRDILCIGDSSEVNVSGNRHRHRPDSGLGRSDNADNASCFKIHPALVLDADRLVPLGFSGIKVYHRPVEQVDRFARDYKKLPIDQKESYKWIEVSSESKKVLAGASRVTFIQDREGDIYEQFCLIPDERHHLLVRSRVTRRLAEGSDLYAELPTLPIAGHYTVEIPADKRKGRKKRMAEIAVRYGSFELRRPANLKRYGYPELVRLNCVWAHEVTPGVSDPVDWKLLTTHGIAGFADAAKLLDWYGSRWYIEQVFRLLKNKGFGIEGSQLESGWAIRKLVLMQLSALLKILQMNIAYSDPEGGQPIEEVFTQEEIEVLGHMNNKLQGSTAKTRNNNSPKTVKWAAWVIGRMGGWKGYESQGPPGVICLKNGLERLANIMEGIKLAKDMCTG